MPRSFFKRRTTNDETRDEIRSFRGAPAWVALCGRETEQTFRGIGYSVGPWVGAQFFQRMKSPVMLWGALGFFFLAWSKHFRRGGAAEI